ncbi:uncharacterized protein LOC127729333 [Mytilus californianus]|uniref:uncharacterized protein LOC127729333 n=1 Tax=Mytilus californianus TaxID=6549 RepID=UPI0022482D87|nr:uncharacterized protein LOC127729333 [Mytilus californianus]
MYLIDGEVSTKFYQYLCNIFGLKEGVRTRREIFVAMDFVSKDNKFTYISSGSKSEGLDLAGSDNDRMAVIQLYRVYGNVYEIHNFQNKMPIVMDTFDVKPGFTKLKLLHGSPTSFPVKDCCELIEGDYYISSKLFKEFSLQMELPGDMIIHGPCISNSDAIFDGTYSFCCQEWFSAAHPWIYRSGSSNLYHALITSIVEYGTLFVPVGSKDSTTEDLEWRISFSVAEKHLIIFSFSHTQLLCYAVLKILLKDIIKEEHGDLLCSYFIKTIMLWLNEETSSLYRRPENLISCFITCLRRLIYCVKYKTCLQYFIPDNNLFFIGLKIHSINVY